MKTQLEHANMDVENVDSLLDFIQAAFPDFAIRYDSGEADPERWVHVGNEDFYLALSRATGTATKTKRPYDGNPGLNHLGFVVEDTEAVRQRLLKAGYTETTVPNAHPARRRLYFNDAEGNDWEFVQYLSVDKAQRNDYLQEMVSGLVER